MRSVTADWALLGGRFFCIWHLLITGCFRRNPQCWRFRNSPSGLLVRWLGNGVGFWSVAQSAPDPAIGKYARDNIAQNGCARSIAREQEREHQQQKQMQMCHRGPQKGCEAFQSLAAVNESQSTIPQERPHQEHDLTVKPPANPHATFVLEIIEICHVSPCFQAQPEAFLT